MERKHMTMPAYGIIFNADNTDPRPAQASDLSVIGLVLPSEDADAGHFPLDTPVVFDSSDASYLSKIGTGDLYQAVLAIDSQMADLQTSARIVAVRVAKGASLAETAVNIVGDRAQGTGLYALLKAGPTLGVVPRLIGAPGYTGQMKYGVQSVATTAGSGYTAATVSFSPAGATGTVTLSAGKVTGVTLTNPGSYAAGANVTATISGDGTGATATVTVGLLQDPVCAALPSILNALLAHAVVGSPGTTMADAQAWREVLSDKRLIPVDNWEIVQAGESAAYRDGAASVLGLFARVDFKHSGMPFWSVSGQPVQGILGLKNVYTFSLVDGATQGQELLAAHIGVTERGEAGVETAISESGFVFAGVWNASDDPLAWFYNKTRGRDWTWLALLKSIRLRLGVENVTPQGVEDVLNDMKAIGSELIRQKAVLGFKVGFERARNSADNLRQGKFTVSYAQEEPAPITQVTIDSRPYYEALEVELATLVSQAATYLPQYLGV